VIRSSVIPTRPSGADDAAALAAPRIGDLNDVIAELPDGTIPSLAIVASPVFGLDEPAIENLGCRDEVDTML
jgi:hypothetical protein